MAVHDRCCMYQFQTFVGQFFTEHGRTVARWPLPFLVVPLIVGSILSSGLFFRFDIRNLGSDSQLAMFLPDSLPSLRNLKRIRSLFESRDLLRDRYDMFRAQTAHVTFVDTSPERNLLRDEALQTVKEVVAMIKQITIPIGWTKLTWSHVCMKIDGLCVEHPFVMLLQSNYSLNQLQPLLGYPSAELAGNTVENNWIFGGVELFENATIHKAVTIRIPFLLSTDAYFIPLVVKWQMEFIRTMQRVQQQQHLNAPGLLISFGTPFSWSAEIDRNGSLITPFLPVLLAALAVFSVGCSLSADWNRAKPLLGFCGFLNAVLATMSAFGLMKFFNFAFIQMVYVVPFIIISISLDGMYLLLSAWSSTNPMLSVEDRTGQCFGKAAVSILITSITDGLSFSVGGLSQFSAVRIFCAYCALSVLFNFLYQMTFFVSCMAFSGRSEATGYIAKLQQPLESLSTIKHSSSSIQKDGVVTNILLTCYANIVSNVVVKVICCIIYAAYLGYATYGILNLQVGLDVKDLLPFDSYLRNELIISNEYFTAYCTNCYVVIDQVLDYSNDEFRVLALDLFNALSSTRYTAPGEFWLHSFVAWTNATYSGHLPPSSEDEFMSKLSEFLQQPKFAKFAADVSIADGRIKAGKMLIRLRNCGFENHASIVATISSLISSTSKFQQLRAFAYEPLFILSEQQSRNVQDVFQSMTVDLVVMLLVSVIFMPKLFCLFWTVSSIVSVNVGVIGFLSLWHVRLDLISMICIVMCIGFSVSFVAHTTYHYMTVSADDLRDRLRKTLEHIGLPLIQSSCSTVIGVCSLGLVPSYLVRTFVKSVVLVISIGVAHGLLFAPVFLSIFVPNAEVLQTFNEYQKLSLLLDRLPASMRRKRKRRHPDKMEASNSSLFFSPVSSNHPVLCHRASDHNVRMLSVKPLELAEQRPVTNTALMVCRSNASTNQTSESGCYHYTSDHPSPSQSGRESILTRSDSSNQSSNGKSTSISTAPTRECSPISKVTSGRLYDASAASHTFTCVCSQ